MQLKAIAIDDEPLALELVKKYAASLTAISLVHTFNDAIAGLEYLKKNPINLLFVDINMPDINGLDLVRALPQKPMIVFTTAYKKFAVDSYDLDALDYLLKPIEFERFSKAVNKAVEFYSYKHLIEKKETEVLFVRSEYQLVKIYLNEIEYIESIEDYLKIHVREGKPVMTLMTLKAILEKLPPERFKRIHRSYIISLSKVKSVLNKKVRLTNTEIPIGDSYLAGVQSWSKK